MGKKSVITNLIWRFAERIGSKIISVVIQLVLARLLSPEVFGTVAIVLVITNILQVFIESGFGTALIQKKEVDNIDYSSVFFFNIFACIILYVLLFFLAPIISSLYNNELTNIVRVVGLILIISGIRNIQQAYISRNMLFKRFFFATLIGTIIGGISGIVLALKGYGVWSYILQYLLNNLISTIILWLTVKWRPEFKFSFLRLKALFSYGWKLLAASLLNTVSEQIRPVLISIKFSTKDLAYYNEGLLFPNLITENVNASIDSVLLPALSREQDSLLNIKAMTKRVIKVSSYIMWPILVGIFVCAKPFVSIVLTEKWLPCVPYIKLFCIYYALWPIHTTNLNVIKSVGRSDIFLKLEIIKRILDVVVIIITFRINVTTMAIGMIVEGFICQFINSFPNKKLIDYGFFEQIIDVVPSLVFSLIMGGLCLLVTYLNLSSIITLIIQIPTGIISYILFSVITKNETFIYIVEIIKGFINK